MGRVPEAIREINKSGFKYQLDVYTGNDGSRKTKKALHDGTSTFLHPAVSQEELKEIYHSSDIALHVESFDLKNRLAVRMSFSTKIVDCLSSGCAVMAICYEKQGGFEYLKREDAAICVGNLREIKSKLRTIVYFPTAILEYAQKAKRCCQQNHDKAAISQMIMDDFIKYSC